MMVLFVLEVVSKPQIRFKGKAQADRESAVRLRRMSIYRRPATQPLGLRWGFETTSNAWVGHHSTHLKSPSQVSQINGNSVMGSRWIPSTGQASTHRPQPSHLSLSKHIQFSHFRASWGQAVMHSRSLQARHTFIFGILGQSAATLIRDRLVVFSPK
jgi:hypothetical protein